MAPISEHRPGFCLLKGTETRATSVRGKVLGKPGLSVISKSFRQTDVAAWSTWQQLLELQPTSQSHSCSTTTNPAVTASESHRLNLTTPNNDCLARAHSHLRRRLQQQSFEWEAEDLFDWETIKAFVDSVGGPYVKGTVQRPDGGTHFDLDEAHKPTRRALEQNLTPDAVALWEQLLGNIRSSLGLPNEAVKRAEPQPSETDTQTQTEAVNQQPATDADQRVLVVS